MLIRRRLPLWKWEFLLFVPCIQILLIARSVGIAGITIFRARAGKVVEQSRMESQIHVQFGTTKLSR